MQISTRPELFTGPPTKRNIPLEQDWTAMGTKKHMAINNVIIDQEMYSGQYSPT